MPAPAETLAPAKINLFLRLTGRRADGYHELESLVVFTAGLGDRLRASPANELSLRLSGPFAAGLEGEGDNLALRAARMLDPRGGALLELEKNLPVASGIGGGSSDAAAALHLLSELWGKPLPSPEALLELGADLPVCLAARSSWVGGIGEEVMPAPALPACHLLLVNPGQPLSTGAVFKGREGDFSSAPPRPEHFAGFAALIDFLAAQGNDLEASALTLVPAIGEALAALRGEGAALARMSGSGATCFGLFESAGEAEAAAGAIAAARPGWWVAQSPLSP